MATTVAPVNIPLGGGSGGGGGGGNASFQNYAPGIPRNLRTPNNNPAPTGNPQQPAQGGTFTSFSKFNTKLYQKHLQAVEAAKNASGDGSFDGKQLRKSVYRKTIDYNSSVVKYLQSRVWMRDSRDRRAIQPDNLYHSELVPPLFFRDNPLNAVTTKFIRTSTNKIRCPIFSLAWTPDGRRLMTGASSGEFTLWNGLTFNFETILQAHDSAIRHMVWNHNDTWMISGDHNGFVKYWQSNMNNVKMFQAHKEAIRQMRYESKRPLRRRRRWIRRRLRATLSSSSPADFSAQLRSENRMLPR